MAALHLFVSTSRFASLGDIRRFVDQTYTEDGDEIDSPFAIESGLENFEPACIEVYFREAPVKLASLLAGASYADQWGHNVPTSAVADSAICVFEPNTLRKPHATSLTYLGAFHYETPANSQW